MTTNAIAAQVTMTTTPAASMAIPIFSITSLNTISPLLTWPGRDQSVSRMGNCSNVPGPK